MRVTDSTVLRLRTKALDVDFYLLYVCFDSVKPLVDSVKPLVDSVKPLVDLLKPLVHSTEFIPYAFKLRLDSIVEGFYVVTYCVDGAFSLMEFVLDPSFELLLIRGILVV
jgi:hypothetical protein